MKVEMPPLAAYAAKRRFTATPEPPPERAPERSGPLLFVVQKHAARRTHYDLRLELDGVLKSWAVPQGLPLEPGVRRLALPTEDHPFEYASFEGLIPQGQYGAGAVIIWDCGVYAPEVEGGCTFADRAEAERRAREGLERGKLSIVLLGQRLKGSYALIQTRDGKWLILKHRDPFAVSSGGAGPNESSVLSGLTLEDLRHSRLPLRIAAAELVPHGPGEALPKHIQPMLAHAADAPFTHPDWLHEPKLDGYRVIARVEPDTVRLRSRRGLDLTPAFPEVVTELEAAAIAPMVLDGELIACDASGKPSFNALQQRAQLNRRREIERAVRQHPCTLYCFDLLHFAGVNLRDTPFAARKRYLAQCLLPSRHVQLVLAHAGDGKAFFDAAVEAGFEGMLAKRRDSRYEPGVRSQNWLKVKATQTAEFVIVGYTAGEGTRAQEFGALVLGYRREAGQLAYCGRVGTGFDDAALQHLLTRLKPLQTGRCPLAEEPKVPGGTVWVRPELVAEVKFAAWTEDGALRAPVFLRLREDLTPDATGRRPVVHVADDTHPVMHGSVAAAAVLQQLENQDDRLLLRLDNGRIALSNLNKVYWPEDRKTGQSAVTKRDYLRYLVQIGPGLLPLVADRPLTLIRMPEGIGGHRFFQKHWEQRLPEFVETIRVLSENATEDSEYLLCNNLPTVLWLGQIGTLEFHVWHSRASTRPDADNLSIAFTDPAENIDRSILNFPDYLVFDIDPYIYSGQEAKGSEPEFNVDAFEKAKEVAFWLKELLDALALQAFVKTSGKTGLHVFVPIVRSLGFDAARGLCETVCRHLLRQQPDVLTVDWSVTRRTGKIFLDYNMNVRGKTLVAAYSPRALPGAPISMPLTWKEVELAHPWDFTVHNAFGWLERRGDPWAGFLDAKQRVEDIINAGN